MELKTPDWNLAGLENFVYEPAEDTFLMLDVLEQELNWIQTKAPRFVLEIGSGSGVIITALSKALANSAHFIATDINPMACKATQRTAALNNAQVDVLETDLACGLQLGVIDMLVWNPPYVVTEPEELLELENKNGLDRAVVGGIKGRQVMDRLFPQLPHLLSQNSCCYFVVIEDNCPGEISMLMKELGFLGDVIGSRRVRGEYLSIMKFVRCS